MRNLFYLIAYAYTTGAVGTAVQSHSYTYGSADWKDKLTAYDGAAIQTDNIGNPTTDGIWSYTWQHGRQLKQMSKTGETVTFEYNEDGLRTKKTSTSKGVTEYTLHGKNIVHLTRENQSLHFFYDGQGKPSIVEWNNGTTTTKYAYVYNLQGDVIALINSAGTKVVGYTYDAWGKPIRKTGTLADTLGALNPFRYRGYVYDDETGLYYLRSRYYNAKLTRFVSIDIVVSKIGDYFSTNSYTYVKNDPIDRADANGTDSYYVIFDSRENGKGLSLQGKWAINLLESMGHSVERKGYTDIPGFITAWNYAGNKNFDYIVIYAHGSPGTIDCNHGYLKETMFEGKIGDNYCFSSISRLDEIQVQKRIFLFSCHGATPNNDYKTAIGMLSSKAGYVATEGSAYASVNYVQGTGIPEQGPGWNWTGKSLIRNILDLSYWLFSSCWVTFSDSGLEISDRPSFP